MTKSPEQFDGRFMRVMASVIAPGAVALLPWVAVAAMYNPPFGKWLLGSPPLALAVLALAVFCVGMAVEDFGSRLETCLDQKCRTSMPAWWTYLSHKPSSLIGHSYISSLVTRLKFELGMVFSLPSAAIALAVLCFPLAAVGHGLGLLLISGSLAGAIYFRIEAATTVRLLNVSRKKLNANLHRLRPEKEDE